MIEERMELAVVRADFGIGFGISRGTKLHRTAITTKLSVQSMAELTRLMQEVASSRSLCGPSPKGSRRRYLSVPIVLIELCMPRDVTLSNDEQKCQVAIGHETGP